MNVDGYCLCGKSLYAQLLNEEELPDTNTRNWMTSSRENVSYPQSSDGTRTKVMHKGYFHSHTFSNHYCGSFMLILHFSKTKVR